MSDDPNKQPAAADDGDMPASDDRLGTIGAPVEQNGEPLSGIGPQLAAAALDAAMAQPIPDGETTIAPEVTPFDGNGAHVAEDAAAPEGAGGVRWPPGCSMRTNGLYWSEDPKSPPLRLSDPFEVRGECRLEDNNGWGLVLRFEDPDRVAHEVIIPRADLSGDGTEVRRQLLAAGLRLGTGRTVREKFIAALAGCSSPDRVLLAKRTGWHQGGQTFVLPTGSLGAQRGAAVHFDGVAGTYFATSGTLETWKTEVGRLAEGQDRLLLALGAALSGPLLEPLGLDGGGFHLFGASSTGKTTSLYVAGSVWGGGGPLGFGQLWRITANAQEGVAAAHNDCLLCLDEVGTCPPNELESASYVLAGGQGKSRMRSDGSLKGRARWRISILSTGEVTLKSRIAEGRSSGRGRAGQETRIIDVPADAEKGWGLFDHINGFDGAADLSKAVRAATARHYGWAGPAFIEHLLAEGVVAIRAARRVIDDWRATHLPTGADGQVIRVADRFALAAAAGELGIAFSILPLRRGVFEEANARLFADWIKRRGGIGSAEARDTVARVRHFLQAHSASRFVDADSSQESWRAQNIAGARSGSGDDRTFFFHDGGFAEACGSTDLRPAAAALDAAGYLVRQKNSDRLKVQRRIQGQQQRVYAIRGSILEGDDA